MSYLPQAQFWPHISTNSIQAWLFQGWIWFCMKERIILNENNLMQKNKRSYGRIDLTCIEICNRCHFHIIIPRICEVVLKVALANVKCWTSWAKLKCSISYSWRLAIVDSVDEPEVVDDSVFKEALGVVEDYVNLRLFHRGDNTWISKILAALIFSN